MHYRVHQARPVRPPTVALTGARNGNACPASGKGNADKSVVIKEVYKRFGIDTNDDNTADAVVLGHIGLALTGAFQTTTQEQRTVLDVIRDRHRVFVPAVAA